MIKNIIKRSGDILQILLRKIIKATTNKKDGFKANLDNLKKGEETIRLIESNLIDNQNTNYFSLQETILLFFEKNSLIYLNNVLNDKDYKYIDEGTPLDIFEECVKFLVKYNFSDKLGAEIRHIRKLFCKGYIKVYCDKFFKMINENDKKIKAQLSIENLLEKLVDKEKKMNLMIKIYIYKKIFNQNGKQLDIFLDKNKKKLINLINIKALKHFLNLKKKASIMDLRL